MTSVEYHGQLKLPSLSNKAKILAKRDPETQAKICAVSSKSKVLLCKLDYFV